MQEQTTKYIFIDESGDPTFYGSGKRLLVGTPGFQPYLIIGMIETSNRKALRKKVIEFMDSIKSDVLYNTIPSVNTKKEWYVHARVDHPEIRIKFIELLRQLPDYKAHIVIARKDLSIFNRKHNNNPSEFYFDVLHHLLENKMIDGNIHYKLYLSQRGNNSMKRFSEAVTKALKSDAIKSGETQKINYSLEIVPSEDMPELSVIDYLMWAVQRKLLKGEARYFEALKEKYGEILELYKE
jgi:hypothetical protein